MSKTYDAQKMVELPMLDADTITSVCTELLTVAKREEKMLSEAIRDARGDVSTEVEGLKAEMTKTLLASSAPGGTVADPEKEENASWTSGEHVAIGKRDMPSDDAEVNAAAQRIIDALYAEGVTFLRGTPHKRWSETDKRANLLLKPQFIADFKAIGCEDVRETIIAKHRATGQALGFTAALPVIVTPQIRTHFNAVKAALRYYILQVAASANPKKPATVALAAELLKPIAEYEPPPRAKAVKAPQDKEKQDGKDKQSTEQETKEQDAKGQDAAHATAGTAPAESSAPAAP